MTLRLAGAPEEGARAVGGEGAWRWAQANLPAPDETSSRGGSRLFVLSGAQACVRAAGPDFVSGVEGESLLLPAAPRGAGAADAAMAAWLACGAALAGARSLAESGPAESEPAARWCRDARVPLLLTGGAPAGALGPERLAALAAEALRSAEAEALPARIHAGQALACFESMPQPPEPGPGAGFPAEAPLRGGPSRPDPRPAAFAASVVSPASFLDAGPGALETALAGAASAAYLRPADLFVFSAAPARLSLRVPQAWGLGEGAAPAGAGARFHDRTRKCAAVIPAPRGMALGWLVHLAARNADLLVIAQGADAAARAALTASGLAFHARLRPGDGKAAEAALLAALRHRGLAFLEISAEPTAVLSDGVRPRAWEETPA